MLFWPIFWLAAFIITAYVVHMAQKHQEIGPLLKQAFWLCIPLIILVSLYLVGWQYFRFF